MRVYFKSKHASYLLLLIVPFFSLFNNLAIAGEYSGDILLINETHYSVQLVKYKNRKNSGQFKLNPEFNKTDKTLEPGHSIRIGTATSHNNAVIGEFEFALENLPDFGFSINYDFSTTENQRTFTVSATQGKQNPVDLAVEEKITHDTIKKKFGVKKVKHCQYRFTLILTPRKDLGLILANPVPTMMTKTSDDESATDTDEESDQTIGKLKKQLVALNEKKQKQLKTKSLWKHKPW